MKCDRAWPLAIVVLVGLSSLSLAQPYSIDWFSINGGGGTSTGGPYSLTGIIGQPAAASAEGGGYRVEGGFMRIIGLVQTPGAPTLRVVLTETNTVVIAWPGSATQFALQENVTLNPADWSPASQQATTVGEEKQVIVSPPVGRKFYRLKYP